ncbi:MAG: Fe-S cluster assembly protein SufD [Prolixibacteraceae bacterium]|nr:Fe-S cluster assembly protein SufD [Prolixibacteraceae bacterium]
MTESTIIETAEQRILQLFTENKTLLDEGAGSLLRNHREVSMKAFQRMGIPSRKVENYKYTDLTKLFSLENYNRAFRPTSFDFDMQEVFTCDVPEFDTHILFHVNGWYFYQNRTDQFPKGTIIKSMKSAWKENAELVETYYGKIADSSADPLVALNGAFAQDGVFIYIPEHVVIEKPIQIINLLRSDEDLYVTQRNLVVLGKNSQVKLMFCDHTLAIHSFVANYLTEIFLGEDSIADVYGIQNQHNGTAYLNGLFVHQGRNSQLITNTISLHGGIARNHLHVDLLGENANASLYGLTLTDKDQHSENFTSILHSKPGCHSNQIFKNVLDDSSTGAFTGRIHVLPGAKKTEAYQRNNSVLMTKAAKMNTKPQLVIDNDDVKCSHGATVGQINEEALFYLMTRGINENEARLMLMFAFAHEVLANIRVEPLRQSIDRLVNKRLRGEVSRCHDCKLECIR